MKVHVYAVEEFIGGVWEAIVVVATSLQYILEETEAWIQLRGIPRDHCRMCRVTSCDEMMEYRERGAPLKILQGNIKISWG